MFYQITRFEFDVLFDLTKHVFFFLFLEILIDKNENVHIFFGITVNQRHCSNSHHCMCHVQRLFGVIQIFFLGCHEM